jgi:hypothetical protein
MKRKEKLEMLLRIDEAKTQNQNTIKNLQESLNGIGGTFKKNRIIWLEHINEFRDAMKQQEQLFDKILNALKDGQYKVTNEGNDDVELFDTMEEVNDYIQSELDFMNVTEKIRPYTKDDFNISDKFNK